jgi:hypothetical protein
MSVKYKILFIPLVAGLILSFFPIIYAEKGLLQLRSLEEEKNFLIIENSEIGLKLIDEIDIFKRLAKDDLKLIDHLARKQGMVGKNELILIPREPIEESKTGEPNPQDPDYFRILTDDEIDELLKFDIKSFKFYEKLKENDEDSGSGEEQTEKNKKDSDEKISLKRKGKILGSHKNVTIQVAAFKDRNHAKGLVKKLKKKGYQAYLITSKSSGGTIWHKVRIGKFKNITNAHDVINQLKGEYLKPYIVKR